MMNISVRILDKDTKTKIKAMVKMKANRKLIQQRFSGKKTEKTILMQDIHHVASNYLTSLSEEQCSQSSSVIPEMKKFAD